MCSDYLLHSPPSHSRLAAPQREGKGFDLLTAMLFLLRTGSGARQSFHKYLMNESRSNLLRLSNWPFHAWKASELQYQDPQVCLGRSCSPLPQSGPSSQKPSSKGQEAYGHPTISPTCGAFLPLGKGLSHLIVEKSMENPQESPGGRRHGDSK